MTPKYSYAIKDLAAYYGFFEEGEEKKNGSVRMKYSTLNNSFEYSSRSSLIPNLSNSP